jgi:hypothetical protein
MFKILKEYLNNDFERYILDWFPNAKRGSSNTLYTGNFNDEVGQSLVFNLNEKYAKDFSTGETAGDIISIYAKRFCNGDNKEALFGIIERYNLNYLFARQKVEYKNPNIKINNFKIEDSEPFTGNGGYDVKISERVISNSNNNNTENNINNDGVVYNNNEVKTNVVFDSVDDTNYNKIDRSCTHNGVYKRTETNVSNNLDSINNVNDRQHIHEEKNNGDESNYYVFDGELTKEVNYKQSRKETLSNNNGKMSIIAVLQTILVIMILLLVTIVTKIMKRTMIITETMLDFLKKTPVIMI